MLDPRDRQILDFAHMEDDPDQATMRRLLADETARAYAAGNSSAVGVGWLEVSARRSGPGVS